MKFISKNFPNIFKNAETQQLHFNVSFTTYLYMSLYFDTKFLWRFKYLLFVYIKFFNFVQGRTNKLGSPFIFILLTNS